MIDFGLRCVTTAGRGKAGWLPPILQSADCPRGMASVTHDGLRYFYRVQRAELKEFKSWIRFAGFASMNCPKLTGTWPDYYVD